MRSFKELLNTDNGNSVIPTDGGPSEITADTSALNADKTVEEVRYAIYDAGKGKATGYDGIPLEVLQNATCINFLVVMFNECFNSGIIPNTWSRGIINPILKDPTTDPRDAMNYRGITITSIVYELFCSVLNNRLVNWFELNNGLCDEQGGFRSGRCTSDHIESLTSIIETRMKKKLDTFAIFIDFSKAYDRINREFLWHKLSMMGVTGTILNSLKSLYDDVQCAVRINNTPSDWFSVSTGLKQGCILSPLLFNAFVNDLVQKLNQCECGIAIGNYANVSALLYADDIVIVSGDEQKLQTMLNCLYTWCSTWGLTINFTKSKAMHFRRCSSARTDFMFECGTDSLDFVSQYKYLGVMLNENLDLSVMLKAVAKSASRALGLLIAKDKAFGGMPYSCFQKCYDSLVQSIIDYSSSVWGTKPYTCISAVQNKACRYYLGLGRYAPNTAVNGDMGWDIPEHRQWLSVTRKWCRIIRMSDTSLTKKIFLGYWAQSSPSCKTWFFKVTTFFAKYDVEQQCLSPEVSTSAVLNSIKPKLLAEYELEWPEKLNSDVAMRGINAGGNKLRTYRKFKHSYSTEPYAKIITSKKYRSAYAKFRCGVAPLKIETCRYGLNRILVEERLCESCQVVEDEFHVMMVCPLFNDIRSQFILQLNEVEQSFNDYTQEEQFIYVMSNPAC